MKADILLYNARVITLDSHHPHAQIVAIRGDKIAYVGSKDEIEHLRGVGTMLLDCAGKTLVPGFNDAHCHIFSYIASLLSVDCSQATSLGELKEALRRKVKNTPPGTWITATGYDESRLVEKRHPTRKDLDEATTLHPVKLVHRTGLACVLNSLGLALAGIISQTPEPPGALFERELETGEPNGLLFGMNAYLSQKVLPPLSREEINKGIRLANRNLLSLGITSLQDATVTNDWKQWQAFKKFKEEEKLASRVALMIGSSHLRDFQEQGFSPGRGDSQLRLGAVKIVLERVSGSLNPLQEELERQVDVIHRAGYQAALHAVEESTLEAALQALEYASRKLPRKDHRHRIEHCSLCPPSLLQRLRATGAMVVTQPPFLYYSGDRYLKEVPESQRVWLYPFCSLLRGGVRVAASSDFPVALPNPLVGIYAAVTRKSEAGKEVMPKERLSPLEALALYTRETAYATFEEGEKGTISPGKLADLALLSQDPTAVTPELLKEIKVEMTLVGGKVVWESS